MSPTYTIQSTVPNRKPSTGKAALGNLEYINGTTGFGTTFQIGTITNVYLEVFADADFASKTTDRRSSVSGGANMCGGVCVCWFPRRQKCFTLSMSEAELFALSGAVKVISFPRHVWRFILPGKRIPCFPIFEDNQGAVQLSQNPVSNSISKHIDVRHHLLRELARQGDISVNHVPPKYQHANILTKALAFDLSAIRRAVDRPFYVCIFISVFICFCVC